MLVIFGANGRTGRALLEAALVRRVPVRPVVRDDRDARGLHEVVDVNRTSYADADHKSAVMPVLEGATAVVSCINPRIAGPGAPPYAPPAAANIIECAVEAGIDRILHLSVVGAYRWSPNRLNREAFKLDRLVWKIKDKPWSMFRVSCFIDEILDGHVRPPDGRRPHPLVRSARYTPLSRRDLAEVVLDDLPALQPNRTFYVGGPETFTGEQLEKLVAPYRKEGGRRRTAYGQLPPGDVSVHQETTLVSVGRPLRDRMLWALDPSLAPGEAVVPAPAPEPEETPPIYQRQDPGPHPADEGRDLKVLREMGPDLRRVVHDQLAADLRRLGLGAKGVKLDFRSARACANGRAAEAHGGTMVELTGVAARGPSGERLHQGPVSFLRDVDAEVFHCWWDDGRGLPPAVWEALDLGVKRRLASDPAFARDPLVQAYAGGHEVGRVR